MAESRINLKGGGRVPVALVRKERSPHGPHSPPADTTAPALERAARTAREKRALSAGSDPLEAARSVA